MAVSLLTMAFFLAIAIAPTVSVTDRTAGCATGIDAMVKTSANPKISKKLSWRIKPAMNIKETIIRSNTIRQSPIVITAL